MNTSLRELMTKDPTFRPKEFLNGARMAYEMIVMGFADGDRKTLKNLLSKEVFDGSRRPFPSGKVAARWSSPLSWE